MNPALLQAVLDAPDDDAQRLVYADEIEATLPSRCEFIRTQVKLAKGCKVCDGTGHNAPPPCNCSLLRRRERELLRLWAPDWIKPIDGTHMTGWAGGKAGVGPLLLICGRDPNRGARFEVEFRRGFVDSITCAAAAWFAYGPAIVRAMPVTRVVLTDQESFQNRNGVWDYELPSTLYAQIIGLPTEGAGWSGNVGQPYSSRQAALDAVSAVCIAWAAGQK